LRSPSQIRGDLARGIFRGALKNVGVSGGRTAIYSPEGDQAEALRTGDHVCHGTATADGACEAADRGKPATQVLRDARLRLRLERDGKRR
jgi:hypothetical protein